MTKIIFALFVVFIFSCAHVYPELVCLWKVGALSRWVEKIETNRIKTVDVYYNNGFVEKIKMKTVLQVTSNYMMFYIDINNNIKSISNVYRTGEKL